MRRIESLMRRIKSVMLLLALSALTILIVNASALAKDIDVTAFAGVQRQGKLTFQSAPGTLQTINSTSFGVFGGRIGHGHIFGGEHTFAYSPNFIDVGTKAFIYNSNVILQAPLPVIRPYGTAGLGLMHISGENNALVLSGTKFALNYGGGVKFFPAGPVGLRVDVRGYSVPSTEFRVFGTQSRRTDFVEASIGVVFAIRK
jgi:opacity protein-like surface antigen